MNKTMPFLTVLSSMLNFHAMNSVFPTVSSVAWTSFATGTNPAGHGIFGFTDRHPDPFDIFIPISDDRKKTPIWNSLPQDMEVNVVNVPLTYPPEQVNGKMVSCFLCSDIKKAAYPKELVGYLESIGYIIDVDSWVARQNMELFIKQLTIAMNKRFELAFELLQGNWNYFQLHIMETDRLMHFAFDYLINPITDAISILIESFWSELDKRLCELYEKIKNNSEIIILSDHGFCKIKYEFELNVWLRQQGLLCFNSHDKQLSGYCRDTTCYALTPGRIYLNLEGREHNGRIHPKDYENVRYEIKKKLLSIHDPITNEPVIKKVMYREEIYNGRYLVDAPDIIIHPHNGYDFKSSLEGDTVFSTSALNGMHTYEDAVIMGSNIDVSNVREITDVYDVMYRYMSS